MNATIHDVEEIQHDASHHVDQLLDTVGGRDGAWTDAHDALALRYGPWDSVEEIGDDNYVQCYTFSDGRIAVVWGDTLNGSATWSGVITRPQTRDVVDPATADGAA